MVVSHRVFLIVDYLRFFFFVTFGWVGEASFGVEGLALVTNATAIFSTVKFLEATATFFCRILSSFHN